MEYITTVSLVSLLITKITYCRRQSVCTERSFFFQAFKKVYVTARRKGRKRDSKGSPILKQEE